MSSLFADTMRATVVCNASGVPETPESAAYRLAWEESRRGLCPFEFELYEETLHCDEPEGHEGDHQSMRDDDDETWEIRWRKNG